MTQVRGETKKKISMIEAINIITNKYTGDVIEAEMERGFYEIKIKTKGGEKRKFYIDSRNGMILREKREKYDED